MKKIILSLILLFICNSAQAATTWYVRVNGGTAQQCTGTTNADYGGSGTGQACAFSHPAYAIGAFGTSRLMAGGDTLIVDDNSGTAQYMVGYGMPNTLGCSSSSPTGCFLNVLPSGPDASHPTRILGSAYATGCGTKPQIWGTQEVFQIFKLQSVSNIDIECIEITDHSNCGFRLGPNQCSESGSFGTYGRIGIGGAGITNLTLKNLDIHGMADRALLLGGLTGSGLLSHVNIDGNYIAGYDGDTRAVYGGTGAINAGGILNFDYVKVRFNGCQEAYPRHSTFNSADYGNCVDQNANPPGYGDGVATYDATGTFNITRSEFSHNVQDGLDLLYCPNCDISIDKVLAEGNDGNQIKASAHNLKVTNSVLIANCNYFTVAGKVYNISSWSDCRASGEPISSTVIAGSNYLIQNVTAYSGTGSGGSPFMLIESRYGTCNGTEVYNFKNNVWYSPDAIWNPVYNNLTGSCSTALNSATYSRSNIYHFQSNPSGTGNVFTNPLFTAPIANSSISNVANLYLTASSPGKGTATSGLTFWNTSTDYNNFSQNSPTDMGGIQYLSTAVLAQSGQACTAATDCSGGVCTNFACSGSCTANAGACSGTGQSLTCCSAYCNGSTCANPPTCGDGIIQPGEICDTTALNNQTCISQGFTAGTLACASNCASYNTASCTSSTVFPLTPILDTATHANSTGLGTNWSILAGGLNISSNAIVATSGVNNANFAYWLPSSFLADEEVYTTIASKGTNGDSVVIYMRLDPLNYLGYKLEITPSTSHIFVQKIVPGEVQLGATITQAISNGDSVGLSVSGSTLTVWYKAFGGSWTSLGTRTDTTYTTGGSLGLNISAGVGVTPDMTLTNFGGGSLNPVTCGNGLKETGETCDGTDLGGQSCITQGFASGTLTCAGNCNAFVTSSCVTASVCGNNIKESGELCDGTDINSTTCVILGFTSGTPTCASNCLSFTTTACVSSSTPPGINGGVILK